MRLLERVGRERLLFGHRGVPEEAPENTLASFRRAVELGLDGVELDARLCRTGELVVIHDERVDKLTDGSGNVDQLSFEEIRKLDAGVRFGGSFRGERIPSLEEAIETLRDKMLVNVELKTKSIPGDGLEGKVVALVEKMGLESSVILSSFNPFSIRRVKQINPTLTVGLLFSDDQPIHLRRAWAARFVRINGLHPRYPLVTERLIRRARANKWFVGTWTVDEADVAARLFRAGVNIVMTNRPRQLRDALKLAEEYN